MCREAMPVDGFGNWTNNGRRALLVPDRQAASAQGRVGDFPSRWIAESCRVFHY